jgi:hypothetical protein
LKVRSASSRTARCWTEANSASRSSPNAAQDQQHRHGIGQGRAVVRRQGIDDAAIEHRDIDGGDLGQDHEHQGDRDPDTGGRMTGGPEIRQQG